jgi:CBS domain-containing protein
VRVEGITLWLFGGVARLSGQAPSPGAEVRLAGVGPLVSLVLGALFIAATAIAAAAGVGGLPLAALGWLGAVNVALAVFNVIPAAPLDGGRLLRALVWWRTRDRYKATVYASRAGQAFGWLLVAYGIISLFTQRNVGSLWLALIGWFLIAAATSESRQAAAQSALAHIPAEQVMSAPVVTVPAAATVEDLLSGQLTGSGHSAFPITDQAGHTVGLVTRDQVRNVPAADRGHTTLAQAACPLEQVPSCRTAEPLSDVMERLHAGCAEGRALVFDDGHLAGIISARDITRALRSSGLPERTVASPF